MLRLIVLVLVLLNVGYYAWGEGWLLPYGWGPMQQREPQRLAQQVRPEALVISNVVEAAALAASAAAKTEPLHDETACWQSAVLDGTQAAAVRLVLAAKLPDQAWSLDELVQTGRWIIYLGKYASLLDLDKKRVQLVAMKLRVEVLTDSPLGPGLSLGDFASQEAANAALKTLANRGVRTARVLQNPPVAPGYRLRLPALSSGQEAALPEIRAALPGNSLQACTSTAAP